MKTIITVINILFLYLLGCQTSTESDANKLNTAEIIFGKSIDGVEIGDDVETVINKLGQPDEIVLGDFAGNIYLYKKGVHKGLSVSIYSEEGKGVASIGVGQDYSGKTKQGIGIGSERINVIESLGNPSESGEGAAKGSLVDLYNYENNKFGITYTENKIESISMSYNP